MAEAFIVRRGGASLNFKVVGGTTQPATATENTIWVNTSADITSWVFSSVQPSSPENGMVWFATGTSGHVVFNALKNNTIQIYPVAASQYIDGAWTIVSAKSYQSGLWVDLRIGFIFKNGEYGEISGFNVTKSTQSISSGKLSLVTSGNVASNAYSKTKINLSGINSIVVTIESGSKAYNAYFGVSKTVPSAPSDSKSDAALIDAVCTIDEDNRISSFSGTYSLDVSSFSGEYYLVFLFEGTSSDNGTLIISAITYG